MTETAKKTGASIIPVDSEHSAIFQCLVDRDKTTDFVEKVILTASGGPFRYRPADSMGFVSVDEALKHPSWSMGNKITVDSATMMNKGLELIEARYLFDLSSDKLDVYIHPQSIVHSMVSYVDGSTLAQLGYPDMRTPISYALNYPKRLNWGAQPLTPDILNGLTFFKPDTDKYKCFKLALEVLHEDKNSLMIVMNASNEIAVDSFLKGYIDFVDIYTVISKVLERFTAKDIKNIDEIILLDKRVRSETATIIKNLRR
jgi:1-deoxy-D-xylulose-5-phosphate reductoisomerase